MIITTTVVASRRVQGLPAPAAHDAWASVARSQGKSGGSWKWAYVQSSVELVCQVRGLCPKLSSADVPVSPNRIQITGARGTENRAQTSQVYLGTCSGSKNISDDDRTDTRTCLRYRARFGLFLPARTSFCYSSTP